MVSNLKEAEFLLSRCVLKVFGAHVHWARDFMRNVCLIFDAISLIIFESNFHFLSFSFQMLSWLSSWRWHVWNLLKRLDSASNSKIARMCSRTQFRSIFSNDFHISWYISFVFSSETLRHQDCMFGLAMPSEVADLWCVEEECFAPPLSRLMVEWECPKFSNFLIFEWSKPMILVIILKISETYEL